MKTKTATGVTGKRAILAFMNRRACSDTLFSVLDRAFDPSSESKALRPRDRKTEERAAQPLAGGLMTRGYQCGMIWGATLAAGAQAYRIHGAGPQAETSAVVAAQRIVTSFRKCNRCINCSELTAPDLSSPVKQFTYFVLKGGTVGCFRMAGRYAPIAFREVSDSFATASDQHPEVPCSPVSCSALLAQKAGASPEHTVMAAGLAGGIGLCGGGCGALGAALWLAGIRELDEGLDGSLWDSKVFQSKAEAIFSAFLGVSGHEYECSEIIGRRFEDLSDHANHVRSGGCATIIETLATECASG